MSESKGISIPEIIIYLVGYITIGIIIGILGMAVFISWDEGISIKEVFATLSNCQ